MWRGKTDSNRHLTASKAVDLPISPFPYALSKLCITVNNCSMLARVAGFEPALLLGLTDNCDTSAREWSRDLESNQDLLCFKQTRNTIYAISRDGCGTESRTRHVELMRLDVSPDTFRNVTLEPLEAVFSRVVVGTEGLEPPAFSM